MEEFPVESDVANALLNWSGDIMNMLDAIRYLAKVTIQKDNHHRFLCYLICLKVIKDKRPQWIPSILEIGQNYHEGCKRFVEDCYADPCGILTEPSASAIKESVEDHWEWFMAVCYNQGIAAEVIGDAQVRIMRIFTILSKNLSGFKYHRQYARIAYMMYAVALSFSSRADLPNFFAEAMCYSMTRAMISLCAMTQNMMTLKLTDEHINTLERLAKRFTPNLVSGAYKNGVDLIAMTMSWEVSMFTNVHCPSNLLLIWDHILFHVEEYHFFLRFLFVAHFKAIEKAQVNIADKEAVDNIMWDAVDILQTADKLMEDDLVKQVSWWTLCPCYSTCSVFFRTKSKADQNRIKAKKFL